jgi:hypothetical protein
VWDKEDQLWISLVYATAVLALRNIVTCNAISVCCISLLVGWRKGLTKCIRMGIFLESRVIRQRRTSHFEEISTEH